MGRNKRFIFFAKLPCLRSWLVDYSWLSLCLTQQNYCQTLIIPIQWFVCLSHLYVANFYLFSMPWISFQQFIQSRFNDSENDTQYICTCSQNVETIQRSISFTFFWFAPLRSKPEKKAGGSCEPPNKTIMKFFLFKYCFIANKLQLEWHYKS